MRIKCKNDIVAENTGDKIFVKDKEYEAGNVSESIILAKDEFGCLQTVSRGGIKNKDFKKNFKVLEE